MDKIGAMFPDHTQVLLNTWQKNRTKKRLICTYEVSVVDIAINAPNPFNYKPYGNKHAE